MNPIRTSLCSFLATRCTASKKYLMLLLTGAVACLGPALPAGAQAQRETVTVAANLTAVNHIWAFWGKERGIFAKYGIDIQIIDNVADPVAALVSGQAQFIGHGVQLHQAAIRGVPVKTVMVTTKDNLGVYAGPAIKTMQDLRGKRIISRYDSLKDVLQRNGIDPDKEINWVVSRGAPLVNLELVKRGEAEAFAGFPAARSQAEEIGLHEVFRVSQFVPGGPVAVVGATDKYIAEHPQSVARFLRATLETLANMRNSREAMIDYTMRVMKYTRAGAEESYASIVRDTPEDGLVSDEALRITLDSIKKGQGNTQNIPLSQVWNFTLLREVLKSRK